MVTKNKHNSWLGIAVGGAILAFGGYKLLSTKKGAEQLRFKIIDVAFEFPSFIKIKISIFNPNKDFSTKILGTYVDVIYNGTTIGTLQDLNEVNILPNQITKIWLPFKISFTGAIFSLYQRLIAKQTTKKTDLIQLIGYVNTPLAQININESYSIK